jgi:hypothetical protein
VREGAARAARALSGATRVMITTGFSVGPGLPETDGPPGAASLGRALRLLGKRVSFITDAVATPPLQAALEALGEPTEVLVFPAGGSADETARRFLAEHRPTHLVAVERPGRTPDGDYRSARAESVRDWNAPLDALFLARGRRTTVGVGDGGNEIGMGNVRARIVRGGGVLPRIASVVRVDHLVVAGTSNWGAYGIVAELSRRAGRDLLHGAEDERAMIDACVAAGAVDGLTGRREATVDGLPLAVHVGILELLRLFAGPRQGARPTRKPRRT